MSEQMEGWSPAEVGQRDGASKSAGERAVDVVEAAVARSPVRPVYERAYNIAVASVSALRRHDRDLIMELYERDEGREDRPILESNTWNAALNRACDTLGIARPTDA